MSRSWDVAVIGAGPAGTTAALAAARRGARTVLLERADIPRYKTCGGGLVGASRDQLASSGIDLPALARDVVDEITTTWNGRFPATRRARRPLVPMVMRAELDAALTEAAARAGVEVCTGATVRAVDPTGVVELRDGTRIEAGIVVGADGSASRAGAAVGVRCRQVDLGLEGEFPADAVDPEGRWRGRLLLDWGPVPGSYGWVFPKGELLTVGVIGTRSAGEELRAYYRDFVARLGLAGVRPVTETGHLTRVREPDAPLQRDRVLVAGDAAGLLDPWTREGISFALRSGRLAGECAAGRPDDYSRQVARTLGPEIAAGRRMLEVFTRRPELLQAGFAVAPGGFGLFTRMIEGRASTAAQLDGPLARGLRTLRDFFTASTG